MVININGTLLEVHASGWMKRTQHCDELYWHSSIFPVAPLLPLPHPHPRTETFKRLFSLSSRASPRDNFRTTDISLLSPCRKALKSSPGLAQFKWKILLRISFEIPRKRSAATYNSTYFPPLTLPSIPNIPSHDDLSVCGSLMIMANDNYAS